MRTWRSIWRTWPVSHCSFPLPPSTAAFNYHLPRPSSTATFHCHLPPPPSTAHLPPPPSTATFHCHPSTATFHWPFSLALFVARSVQPTRATSTGTSSGSGPPRSGRSVRRCGTKEMINPRGPTRRRVISLVAQVQNVSRQVARANQTMASLYGAQPNTSYRRFIQPPCARALSLLSDLLRHMLATSASCPVLRPPAATMHKATKAWPPCLTARVFRGIQLQSLLRTSAAAVC